MSERIGHFRILETLGRGGMGEVYVAQDEVLGRKVAMKSIRADRRLNAAAKARFLREARVLSSLNHPHICGIYDYVETPESDYLVLELIEGRTLQQALRDGLDRTTVLRVSEQIARVLIAAHAAGVVHRDLKPDNVMLTPSGDIKVLDFGIARQVGGPDAADELPADEPDDEPDEEAGDDEDRSPDEIATLAIFQIEERRRFSQAESAATEIGQVIGTPMYMSPEQAWGRDLTAASDMYSFGLMMQVLFTGRPPYDGSHEPSAILDRARRGEAVPATGVGRDLAVLIRNLRSLDPAARPTAGQAAERLRWILDKPKRRIRNGIIAAVLLVAALGALKYTVDLRRERTQAIEARNDAEDLLELMLVDLVPPLRTVGRLGILDAVTDEAQAYFSRRGDTLDDEDLLGRVRTIRLIGEVRWEAGDADAESAFVEMRELADDLVARDPTNGTWQMELGAAHFYLGAIALEQSEHARAMSAFDDYHDFAKTLVELDPKNPTYQMELAYAYTNRSAAYQAMGEIDAAIAAVEQANEIKRTVVGLDPENRDRRRDLSNGLSWMAAALGRRGDGTGELKHYEEELELRTQLVEEDPKDTRDQRFLATSHSHVAEAHRGLGRPDLAVPHHRSTRTISRGLVRLDPENAVWRRQLTVSHYLLSIAWTELGELDAAALELAAGRASLAELIDRDPENVEWQYIRIQFLRMEAQLAHFARRWSDYDQVIASTLAHIEPLLGGEDRAAALHATRVHSFDHTRWTEMAWSARAREAGDRALAMIESVAGDDPLYRRELAIALLNVGRIEDATPILDELLIAQPETELHRRQRARNLGWLITAYRARGDRADALASGEAALVLRQELAAAAPESPRDRFLLAQAHRRIGQSLRRLGRTEESLPHLANGTRVAASLVAANSDDLSTTHVLIVSRRELGAALAALGKHDEAEAVLTDARATVDALVAQDPSRPVWRYELVGVLRAQADLALRRERWAAALSIAASALEFVTSAAAESPDDRSLQLQLARIRVLEGRAYLGAGELVRAGAAWGRALETIEPIAGDGNDRAHRAQLAVTLLRLDRVDEAAPLVRELLPSEPADSELARVARRKGLTEGDAVTP